MNENLPKNLLLKLISVVILNIFLFFVVWVIILLSIPSVGKFRWGFNIIFPIAYLLIFGFSIFRLFKKSKKYSYFKKAIIPIIIIGLFFLLTLILIILGVISGLRGIDYVKDKISCSHFWGICVPFEENCSMNYARYNPMDEKCGPSNICCVPIN